MPRKIVSGPIRDKERTKIKLLKTVGKIIRTKGFHDLKLTKIAETAGVDKKLIYNYFGSAENLINEYLRSHDFGSTIGEIDFSKIDLSDHGKELSKILVSNMYEAMLKNKELQKIIVWELYEYNEILKKLSDHREALGDGLFESVMAPHFKKNPKKYRAVLALLISSTYYLTIHAESNGSKFVGLDINNEEDRSIILEVISDIVNNAYKDYGS